MADTNAPTPSDPYRLSGETVSHYAVREVLGGGGMGVVYRAEDTRLQRSVALKFLPPAMSQDVESKERFLAEAQAASALDHPNICTVHEFGETDTGQLFIAMAFYAGASLRARLENGPLGLEETLDYGIQIASGLSAAHSAGIVHRDIKPANVVVTDGGLAKIVDFGIARVGEAQLTRTGATVGTTAYMSPEQTTGTEIDGRTDIWALGVVLYECLAGVRPFKGSYEQAVIFSILQEEPESLSSINLDVTPGIETVVNRCLKKDPSARYQEAAALLQDLKAIQSGRELSDFPKSPKRTRNFGAKKLTVAALVVVSIVLALFLGRQLASPGGASAGEVVQVAILPFANVSGDSTDQAFIDGLGYTVSATLTEMEQFVDRLSVIPAEEDDLGSQSPRDAAESLHADVLVTGSVQRSGARIRLTLNLFSAEEDRQTRSTIIDSEVTNMLAMQDSVAQVLAGLLDLELSASDVETLTAGGTSSPEAFDDYTKAQGYLLNFEIEHNVDLAIDLFQKAIEEDARYVLAYAGLGEAYWRKYETTEDPSWVELASDSVDRAVQLNNNLAAVRIIAGRIYKGTGQYDRAEQELLAALTIDSTNAFAHQQLAATYYYLNRLDEAETHYLRAVELKPGYWAFHSYLGNLYGYQGRNEEAARAYRRVIGLRPESPTGYNGLGRQYLDRQLLDSAQVWYQRATEANPDATGPTASAFASLGEIHIRRREYSEAVAMYEHSVELDSTESDFWYFLASAYEWAGDSMKANSAWQRVIEIDTRGFEVNPNDANALIGLALAYVMTGQPERGRTMLERLESIPTKFSWIQEIMAQIAEQLGERDLALRYLEEGFEIGLSPTDVQASPWLDQLRADPKYEALH